MKTKKKALKLSKYYSIDLKISPRLRFMAPDPHLSWKQLSIYIVKNCIIVQHQDNVYGPDSQQYRCHTSHVFLSLDFSGCLMFESPLWYVLLKFERIFCISCCIASFLHNLARPLDLYLEYIVKDIINAKQSFNY